MNSFPEPMVARVSGVARETLVGTRRTFLEKDTHWTLENSVVCYTPAGLKKLLEVLGLGSAAFAWEPAATGKSDPLATPPDGAADVKKISPNGVGAGAVAAGVASAGAAVAARAMVQLRVTAISRNPSIVHARGADQVVVLVRVRTNLNFTVGMPIAARAPAPGSTLYHYEGHCPRWKGRY